MRRMLDNIDTILLYNSIPYNSILLYNILLYSSILYNCVPEYNIYTSRYSILYTSIKYTVVY